MQARRILHEGLVVIVIGQCLGGPVVEARETATSVVDDVEGIKVLRNGPIAVELGLGQERPLAGENFVLTARFKNATEEPIVLRGFAIETAIPYVWFSVDGGAFTRHRRIHPGDVYVPPRGEAETVLKGNDSMEFRVFLARGQLVAPFRRDPSTKDAVDLSIVVCPVLRIVDGENDTAIALESNVLEVTLGAPTRHERDALLHLLEFWHNARADHRPAVERHREFLERYPDVPYASTVRASLVSELGIELDDLKDNALEDDTVFRASIEFCLEKGAPFAESLLTPQYLSFFRRAKRWSLLERVARRLADVSELDRRFHRAQAYAGLSVVDPAAGLLHAQDPAWRRRVKPVLLQCLERALVRGGEYAWEIAPRTLPGLADIEEWALLRRAAVLVLEQDPNDEAAAEALQRARARVAQARPDEGHEIVP